MGDEISSPEQLIEVIFLKKLEGYIPMITDRVDRPICDVRSG